jgi:phage tail-like protein
MDSNGSRFILLDRAADFADCGEECSWDAVAQAFTLARADKPRLPRLDAPTALARWQSATPYVLDDHGQLGRLSDDRKRLEFSLSWTPQWQTVRAQLPPEAGAPSWIGQQVLDPVVAPDGCTFTDLCLGGSGLLALPWSDVDARHGLTALHLRKRWRVNCSLPFQPVRAWVDQQDRIWIAGQTQLALCRGAPLPQEYIPQPDRFEPVTVNPDPLRMVWSIPLPDHEGLRALAGDDQQLAVLAATPAQDDADPGQILFVRPLSDFPEVPWRSFVVDEGVPFASDLCLLADARALLLLPFETGDTRQQRRDCALLMLADGRASLLSERWPRKSEAAVRFVRHRDGQPRCLRDDGVHGVYRLPQARFLPQGTAAPGSALDSGAHGTVWHRLYLEASLPPGCQIGIEVRVSDDRSELPHRAWEPQPEPLWLPSASELPFSTPRVASVAGRSGLFEVLLQRAGGATRELAGRYLGVRFTLRGDGRHSPAIYRARLWYPRFSWQSQYLPEHFHQQLPPLTDAAAEEVPANAADLRERLLACCEGLLTPIEDRIAAAETLLYPEAAPADNLPWLGRFLGVDLPPHWPADRQRRWLQAMGDLQPRRGTFGALCRELDIVTDGAVSRGQVVPVELFRLRHTLGTILGVNMDDAAHPLTLGTRQSGNSIVGDSLILSADHNALVLALFAPELARSAADQQAVNEFFASHSQRVLVLLHGPARRLRRSVEAALPTLMPAAVQWRIVESDHLFVLGLAPLLGIDTYLAHEPPIRPVVLESTLLGRGDTLHNPVALSPEHALPQEIGPGEPP